MDQSLFVYEFSVDYDTLDVSEIVDIHKYLTKKHDYEIMFGFVKQAFIVLLSLGGSSTTKCRSLNNLDLL